MKDNMTILNFSGIYDHESFYQQDKSSCFVDMKDISGTNCMCDEDAKKEILDRISGLERDSEGSFPYGVHFIDNGNYHYVSALYTGMVKEPFSLLVFDHHPDMQAPMFDILSCGGWVLDVIKNNPYLRDVHIIGADRKLIDELDLAPEDRARVRFYDLEEVFYKEGGVMIPAAQCPIYLSIDKDVLSRDEIVTNWDQGELTAEKLLFFIKVLFITETKAKKRKILGIDVCGECAVDQEDCDVEKAIAGNDDFNLKLIQHLDDLVSKSRGV